MCGGALVKTHAFRLAALYFLVFAASVLGVLLFVYWTSADFVERQTEATLDAEITGLAEQYAQRGLSGLIQIVAARSAGDRGDGMLYLVTDPRRPAARRQHRRLAGRGAGARRARCRSRVEVDGQGPDRNASGAGHADRDPGRLSACWSAATSATRRCSATGSRRPCCGRGWSRSASG